MCKYIELINIIKAIKGFKVYLIISSVIRILEKLSKSGIIIFSAFALENSIIGNPVDNYLLLLLVNIIIATFLSYLETYTSHDISFRLVAKIREQAYDKIDEIAPGGLDGTSTIDFATTITSSVDLFELFYAHILIEWIATISSTIILSCFLIQKSLLITLIVIISLVLSALISQISAKSANEKANNIKTAFHKIHRVIADSIFGIKDVLGYHLQNVVSKNLFKSNIEYENTRYYYKVKTFQQEFLYALVELFSLIAIFLILYANFNTNIISIFALSLVILQIANGALKDLHYLGYVFSSARKINEIFDAKSPIENNGTILASDKCFENKNCEITFKNIQFAYQNEKEKKILNDLNFVINSSEVTAIVGKSGSGKSTIAKLIQRFWDVDKGEIQINGVGIRDIEVSELRKLVSCVSQDIYLFQGTLLDNFKLVKPNVTMAEVENKAKLAMADGFIKNLKDGYQTVIGQNGLTLSGGERQRIALTQAFLINTPILILDEASSALDTENEKLINDNIKKYHSNKTVIVIAHRLSTIKSADKIIFLKDGKVEAIGPYDELIKLDEFKKLVVKNEEK